MTWDNGNQLTYPVRYNEIDHHHHYNITFEDSLEYRNNDFNDSRQTGYEIGPN